MYRGIVAGTVVATVKESHLEGVPLLVVRKIENGVEKGLPSRGPLLPAQ